MIEYSEKTKFLWEKRPCNKEIKEAFKKYLRSSHHNEQSLYQELKSSIYSQRFSEMYHSALLLILWPTLPLVLWVFVGIPTKAFLLLQTITLLIVVGSKKSRRDNLLTAYIEACKEILTEN